MSFRILTVCTANQCRSPLAEFALRRAADEAGLDWTVGSAGISAFPGQPPDPKVTEILTRAGEDVTGWSSRRVEEDLLSTSDLILVMERSHRSEIAFLQPAVLARTHLLLGFAQRVAEFDRRGTTPDTLGAALLEAGARQPLQPSAADLEVVDPVGRSRRSFRRCAAELDEAAQLIVTGRVPSVVDGLLR